MMKRFLKGVAFGACAFAAVQAWADAPPRLHVEGSHGRVDVAPTMLDRFPLEYWNERRIADVNDGRRSVLAVRWQLHERWSLQGGYERMRLHYHNPVTYYCPAAVMRVAEAECWGMFMEWTARQGQIHDDVDHLWLGVGFRQPLWRGLSAFADLGYGRMRWQSSGDHEAEAAVDCQTFGAFEPGGSVQMYEVAVDVAGCTPVGRHARGDGLKAAVGVEADLPAGFALSLSWHHQAYRHVIFRNQVLPRVNEANQALCPGGCAFEGVHVPQSQTAWDWFHARLGYDITERFGVFVSAETGGSRAWNVYSGGVRVSF